MTDAPRDFGRELYPFLHAPSGVASGEAAALLHAVRQSTLAKCAEVVAMRDALLGEFEDEMIAAAGAMAGRFAAGATLLVCGNGGSATDADDAVADCLVPPGAGWRALPAVSLVADCATVTALTNDVGFEHVFTRQLAALARPGDIALGFTTSGSSANVVAAMELARRRGLLTIACCGYDGGVLARAGAVDHCFVVRREYVPRIQEVHATLWHALLELVQVTLAARTEVAA